MDLDEPAWDPEIHDFHQSHPRRQLSPMVESPEEEAQEREAKRLRSGEGTESANYVRETCDAYSAATQPDYLNNKAKEHYYKREAAYLSKGIEMSDFMFGVRRNYFQNRYEALAASDGKNGKKKGRKELNLKELSSEKQLLFTGRDGSDAKEWSAWLSKEACEVLDMKESEDIRRNKADLIVPTRWVRANKNDGLVDKDFLAKSRLVVQGFKDRSLGYYRRDAPTASAIAESICLAVATYHHFLLLAKDVKNAYFSGKSVGREVYLEPPRGGLPGVRPGQLLRAKKAIYGFSEAARLFWLALKEHLESDGWCELRLEPALFYLRRGGQLLGILVTHVDDLEGGLHHTVLDSAFSKTQKVLEFSTNHFKSFIFRGREIQQTAQNHVDVSMRNYALSLKPVKIDTERRKHLRAPLTAEEKETFQSSAGELGWLARQLRCDLAYEHGVVQRSKNETCIADFLLLKQFVGQAKRGADFRQRYWSDVNLREGVVLRLADSGHANGTPGHKEELRYRSVGGYFILIANKEILDGKPARANVLAYHSTLTKRVCRSTLAAEASHLAEAVEAGDWIIVLLEEALTGDIDPRNWPEVIRRRRRAHITDARSVYDYLQKDSTSTSSDKRMAIEGALLRETVRQEGVEVLWVDGAQNIANVLTKHGAEKDTLRDFLRSGMMSFSQTPENMAIKEKKREERAKRKVAKQQNQEFKDRVIRERLDVAEGRAKQIPTDNDEDG